MPVPDPIVDRHLADLALRGHSRGTIYARQRAIARMAERIPVPLLDATPDDLAAWRAGLRVTENTVVHYASHARCFYDWAIANDLIGRNPASRLLVPYLVRGLPRPIGDDDLMMAVTGAPARIRPWLVLAGWCGLRAKEIALLRRERVLETRTPPVLIVAKDATKGHRERIVTMGSFVVGELRAAGLPRAGLLFPRLDGKPGPNRASRISQAANAYLHSIGLPETLHQLRHRYGTEGYALTLDIRLVQEQMGHADPATTALYTKYNQARALDLAEGLRVPGPLRAAS